MGLCRDLILVLVVVTFSWFLFRPHSWSLGIESTSSSQKPVTSQGLQPELAASTGGTPNASLTAAPAPASPQAGVQDPSASNQFYGELHAAAPDAVDRVVRPIPGVLRPVDPIPRRGLSDSIRIENPTPEASQGTTLCSPCRPQALYNPRHDLNPQFPRIPIFIINHNKLTTLQQMVTSLRTYVRTPVDIIVHDNNSTYPPLLEYYRRTPELKVYYYTLADTQVPDVPQDLLDRNLTDTIKQTVLGSVTQSISRWYADHESPYYVVSDSDIAFTEDTPGDVLEFYASALEQHPGYNVVGPRLIINDIPLHYPLREKILLKFWYEDALAVPFKGGSYIGWEGTIDTTFGMYRKSFHFHRKQNGLKVGYPYNARHLDWYHDPAQLPADVEFNMQHSSRVIGTWGTNMLRRVVAQKQTLDSAFGDVEVPKGFTVKLHPIIKSPVLFPAPFWTFYKTDVYSSSWQLAVNLLFRGLQALAGSDATYLDLGFGTLPNVAMAVYYSTRIIAVDYEEHALRKMALVQAMNPKMRRVEGNWSCFLAADNATAPPTVPCADAPKTPNSRTPDGAESAPHSPTAAARASAVSPSSISPWDPVYEGGLRAKPCVAFAGFFAALRIEGPLLAKVDVGRVGLGALPSILKSFWAHAPKPVVVVHMEWFGRPYPLHLQAAVEAEMVRWRFVYRLNYRPIRPKFLNMKMELKWTQTRHSLGCKLCVRCTYFLTLRHLKEG